MYTVTFTDNTTFEGGSPAESKWGEIPNKPIKSIAYSLTPYITYHFEDFDAYNHCVERIRGINKGVEVISKVIVMGATKNRVYQIMMDKDGGVFQLVVPRGKEYSPQSKIVDGKFAGWVNGKPLTGWKQGSSDQGANPRLRKEFKKQ